MSLITQCPACNTTFKVVRDQLKISEGWVRCGQCSEVFDSTANLREFDLAVAAAPEPAVHAPAFHEPVAQNGTPWPTDWPSASPPQQAPQAFDSTPEIAQDAFVEPVANLWVHSDPNQPPQEGLGDVGEGFVHPESEPEPLSVSDPVLDIELATVYASLPSVAPPSEAVAAQDFSFIAKTQPSSRWHQPLARAGLVALALLLLVVAGLQLVVHERDRIAAAEARTRPALLALCGWLHCQVNPLRQIESITVDASSFNKQRGDTYLLSFVVKNMGHVALAKPAIELTLTDAQDAPLLRRVLLPSELGANSGVVAPGGEWPGTYVVALTGSAQGSALGAAGLAKSVAGYRVLAFYP